MKNIYIPSIILLAGGLALSACGKQYDRAMTKLNWEAGTRVNEGNFGNPTLNNTLAQAAYAGQGGLVVDLARKFAKDVPTMINFDFNSAKLDTEARKTLMGQADWIKQFPDLKFKVYGHTDLVGSSAYNQRLGLRRANAAVAFLVKQGISIERLEAVASFGETQPLVVTEGRERKNRRTVTEVDGFARAYVGDDLDGKYAHLVYQTYVSTLVASN